MWSRSITRNKLVRLALGLSVIWTVVSVATYHMSMGQHTFYPWSKGVEEAVSPILYQWAIFSTRFLGFEVPFDFLGSSPPNSYGVYSDTYEFKASGFFGYLLTPIAAIWFIIFFYRWVSGGSSK